MILKLYHNNYFDVFNKKKTSLINIHIVTQIIIFIYHMKDTIQYLLNLFFIIQINTYYLGDNICKNLYIVDYIYVINVQREKLNIFLF